MKEITLLIISLFILTACSTKTEEIVETEIIEAIIQYVDDETLLEGEEQITTKKVKS